MSSQVMPTWLRFSERAFAYNFVAFSFVMFSCLFPTGFSATFSTLAFCFALPLFLKQIRSIKLNRFELVGLALFVWLLLSVVWSDARVLESFGYLSEYRIYFMLPVLISVVSINRQTQRWALVAAVLGAFVALVASYGLGLGWWEIEGAEFSLGNRIYHGFIMSSFLLGCLLVARETTGISRLLAAAVALLVVYNILNIEVGRTGYLQVIIVVITLTMLTFSRVQSCLGVAGIIIAGVLAYLSFDVFHERVNQTLSNIESTVVGDNYHSSTGYRLEFYRYGMGIGMDHPLLGVGVGDVTRILELGAETGEIRVSTDNVHNEFINMLMAGGAPALVLFCGFILAIVYSGFVVRHDSRLLGDALVGLGVIIFVSALFNSTIKDYGEKHALIIMLSIVGSHLLDRKPTN